MAGLIKELRWRVSCPRTVGRAAGDFVEKRLTSAGREFLAALSESELDSEKTLDHRRRIAYIYGLARDGSWAPAWNSSLQQATATESPREGALAILREAWGFLQGEPSHPT